MKKLEFGILNDMYGSQLSARQREIVSNYYDFDLSLAEIADNNGVTRQAVADALKKGQTALQQLETDMGFYSKMLRIKMNIENLRDLLDAKNIDGAKNVVNDILELI